MMRMRREFIGRALRLERERNVNVEITMPFVDGIQSVDAKVAAEWKKFADGKMGEAATARWIGRGLQELETVRKKLAEAEKPAAVEWDRKYRDGRREVKLSPEAEAFLYDMQVTARNLGVILDNSRSMTKVLPLVRGEIRRRFPGARFLEVNASSLKMPNPLWGPYGEWYFATILEERNPFDAKWFLPSVPQDQIHYHMIGWKRDTLAAMKSLITLMEADAIYWFCDFEDIIEPAAVRVLEELLTKNKVRLYVHSVKNSPPGAIMNLVRETRGKATRAVPGDQGQPVPEATGPVPELASPITARFLQANENRTVRISGTIQHQLLSDGEGQRILTVVAQEERLAIRFPDRSFKVTASHAGVAEQYPAGRLFEAVGFISRAPALPSEGQTERPLVLVLRSPEDFKVLPSGTLEPKTPGVKKRELDVSRYTSIKATPNDLKSNKDKPVVVNLTVKSVEQTPDEIRITIEGTNLTLTGQSSVYDNVTPPAPIRPGERVQAWGRLIISGSAPVIALDFLHFAAPAKSGRR